MYELNMAILADSYTPDNFSGNTTSITDNSETDWESAMWQLVIEDFKESLFTLSEPTTIVQITLYVPIFLMSLIGNSLVLLVIVPNQRMWSVTNNFLVNLAVADLLVTVLCIPMTVAGTVYRQWVYGDVLCKMTPYLQGVSVTTSTFTITAMSLDRCLAILHPMKFRNLRTKRNVRILIAIIWMTSLLLMFPLLFVNKTKTQQIYNILTITKCMEEWSSVTQRRGYDFSLLFIVCLVPAQIVFVSYVLMGKRLWVTDARLKGDEQTKFIHTGSGSEKNGMDIVRANRRRIAKMCIVVSVIFVVCWLPYYTVNIYLDFRRDNDALDIIYALGLLVGHLHCITNPILYCFMHKTFRHCVMRLLPCWKSRLLRTPSGYGTNAFSKHRMGSQMTSLKSHRNSTKKVQSPDCRHFDRTPSPAASGKSNFRFDSQQECDKTELNHTLPNNVNTNVTAGAAMADKSTPRKVKLILSRSSGTDSHNNQADSFKLIELPYCIKEEPQSQS